MDKFEQLRDFFKNKKYFDRYGSNIKYTGLGTFTPISLDYLNPTIEKLVKDGTIDCRGFFLDAGGGDGRVVALIASIYGIPSITVECDVELTEITLR